jgi:HNH endonuclease
MTTETRTLPDGRPVEISAYEQDGAPRYSAKFPGDAAWPRGYGPTPDGAVTDLLYEEWAGKVASQRRARMVAGLGDDGNLPAGYRSYVHHIDGDPWNNDPANLMVTRKGRAMAYGKIITQQQAEEAYELLGKWRAKNDPGMSDGHAEIVWDALRFVLQYDEVTPGEFIENMGFGDDDEEDEE